MLRVRVLQGEWWHPIRDWLANIVRNYIAQTTKLVCELRVWRSLFQPIICRWATYAQQEGVRNSTSNTDSTAGVDGELG
jgi:hypothetical protein